MTLDNEQLKKVQLLIERFVSRSDVYATQWASKDGSNGGWAPKVRVHCEHGCKTSVCPHKEFEPVTEQTVIRHLQGGESIGVYQLDQTSKVKWLCFDIDYNKGHKPDPEELIGIAKTIRDELRKYNIPSLIEDSTNKGIHIWVLLDNPLPAHVLFSFGRWIMQPVELPDHMHVEVFPKQTQNSSKLGNLVRLPLGIHKKTGLRTQFLNPKSLQPMTMAKQWKVLESYPLVSRDQLKKVFDDNGIESTVLPLRQNNELTKRPKSQRCLVHLLNVGAQEGLRDAGTFRLACLLRDYEIPIELAATMLHEWNINKNDPPLENSEIEEPLASAYNNNYSAYPCSDYQFDPICSSDCYWYDNKQKMRQSRKR